MKLNGSVLVAVAMMLGSIGALGCKTSDNAQAENNAAETPAAEPAKSDVAETASDSSAAKTDESVNVQAKATIKIGEQQRPQPIFVPTAPPKPRFEHQTRRPSTRHFWVNGYWKHVHGRYIWIGGHWDTKQGNRIYVQPHYDRVDGKWRYVPGHWA